jgi:hypothetical protein
MMNNNNWCNDNDYYNEDSEEDDVKKDDKEVSREIHGLSVGQKNVECTLLCLPNFRITALTFDQLLDILIDSPLFYYAWMTTTVSKAVK